MGPWAAIARRLAGSVGGVIVMVLLLHKETHGANLHGWRNVERKTRNVSR